MEWLIGLLIIVVVVFIVLVFVAALDLLGTHLKLLAKLDELNIRRIDDVSGIMRSLVVIEKSNHSIDTRLDAIEKKITQNANDVGRLVLVVDELSSTLTKWEQYAVNAAWHGVVKSFGWSKASDLKAGTGE